jgi:hypothetical protein
MAPAPQVFTNALAMIGRTPLLEARRLDTGPCQLFLKLENQNPGGSIKDRVGLYLIEQAEREGRIKPGGTLIEATAGNTGLGLALVAGQKGYKLTLVIPDKMSQEKIFHLRAMASAAAVTIMRNIGAYVPIIAAFSSASRPRKSMTGSLSLTMPGPYRDDRRAPTSDFVPSRRERRPPRPPRQVGPHPPDRPIRALSSKTEQATIRS